MIIFNVECRPGASTTHPLKIHSTRASERKVFYGLCPISLSISLAREILRVVKVRAAILDENTLTSHILYTLLLRVRRIAATLMHDELLLFCSFAGD